MSNGPQFIRSALVLALAAMLNFGCTPGTGGNANSTANTNVSATANANSAAATTSFTTREPERYSVRMSIDAQAQVNNRPADPQPVQFNFSKIGADRRWEFNMPNVGPAIYLEKSGLKYLILPSQNKYVEINPAELGINQEMGQLLTPVGMLEQLKNRAPQAQSLGTEQLSGRQAMKWQFAGQAQTGAQTGTVVADSLVWVDQETGLPLRSEIVMNRTGGDTARITSITENLQLNPDESLFNVPEGMQKVTTEQLKQQVQAAMGWLKVLVASMGNQGQPAGAAATTTPANANGNANRP
ncbi:MAG TPA: hypothetical protein VIG62_05420 [Blastocatellia bacterium]